jgi:hypothetical protein|tara:strand:- start:6243 stop:6395 length:153 start_codon:yes stop_codon:yes gene_type:complete
LLQLGVARELKYSLFELQQKMTIEELFIWSAYFDLLNDEQEKMLKKTKLR